MNKFFPMAIPAITHAHIQTSIGTCCIFRQIYTWVTGDKKPDENKLMLFLATWPKRISFSRMFGTFFYMKPGT